MEETKIIYYINNEETAYLTKCRCCPDQMTLGLFKKTINRPVSQFLFKSIDEDIGEVIEEITEDDAKLPLINGKVMSWLIIPDHGTESEKDSTPRNETAKKDVDKERQPSSLSGCPKKQEKSSKGRKKRNKYKEAEDTESDTTPDSSNEIDSNQSQATGNCKTINILLLGETGVGKSTWINGFVNYLTYDSLEEAEKGRPVSVIPSTFTLTDSDFKEFEIKYALDNDTNESNENVGESVTQMPKSYVFSMQNVKIRIIDTPGMGDTRGIEKDKENMQNILAHLSHYVEINGIIVLLRPSNSRLNVMFEFCIKELLTHLHKDACKNIVICFTNARGTNYKPGDTMPVLKELLKRNQTIDIKLNKDTVYCIDNESVRFLMAMKTIKFEESEREDFAVSWKKAVEIAKRLISYISSLVPHAIQKTISINEIRRAIIEQSRPMAHIAKAIQMNIDEIEKKQTQINANKNKKELRNKLQIPTTRLKIVNLDYPRTVCTEPKCVEEVRTSDGRCHTRYKTICHERCQEISTVKNVIGNAAMNQCAVMTRGWSFFWFYCKVCNCYSNSHMHITYDVGQEVEMVEDPSIKKLMDEKDGFIEALKEHKKQLEDKLKQLNHEKKRLTEINAHFACFLKHNSIIPFNDALLDYLNYLIRNEKMKAEDGSSSKTLEGLISLKEVYEGEIKAIEDRIKTSTEPNQRLDVKNTAQLMKELKEMPNIGGMLNDIMTGVKEANDASTELNEKQFVMPSTKATSNIAGIIKEGFNKLTGLFKRQSIYNNRK